MADLLSRMISLGLGTVLMARDKVEETVDELIKRGEIGQTEGKKLVEDLIARGEQNRREIMAQIEGMVRDSLQRMGVAGRTEIEELRNEIDLLKKSKPSEAEIYELRADIAMLKERLEMYQKS